jgi:hypothetical protein
MRGMSDWGYAERPALYADLTLREWATMLEGEDPDDRAIREAHGIGYREDFDDPSVTCRNGCGATYHNIAVGKMRKCEAVH